MRRLPSCGTVIRPSSCWASGRRWWPGTLADTDVVGFHRGAAKSCFVVLHYVDGELAAKDWDLIETPMEEEREDIVSALMKQYYGGRGNLPGRSCCPARSRTRCRCADALGGRRAAGGAGHPQRGAKMDLIRLANKNAREEVERATTRRNGTSKLLELLARMLALERARSGWRLRHLQHRRRRHRGLHGGVTRGTPGPKRDYRHFKLKDMEHAGRLRLHGAGAHTPFPAVSGWGRKVQDLPDLLLIDGGVNHANVAVRVLEELNLRIPVFGMVKDDRHRTRALVTPDGREIGIQQNQAIFSLIGQIQEETHRFAIEFHRQQQNQRVKGSVLDKIPGVGDKRRADLLKTLRASRISRRPLWRSWRRSWTSGPRGLFTPTSLGNKT